MITQIYCESLWGLWEDPYYDGKIEVRKNVKINKFVGNYYWLIRCGLTWLTAGAKPVALMSCSRCLGVKLLTPIARRTPRPRSCSWIIAFHVSMRCRPLSGLLACTPCAAGQWIRYRSMYEVFNSESDLVTAGFRRASDRSKGAKTEETIPLHVILLLLSIYNCRK